MFFSRSSVIFWFFLVIFFWICWRCSIASLDYPVVYLGHPGTSSWHLWSAGNCQSLANEVSTVADSVAEMACDSIDDVTGWPQVVMSLEWCLGFVFFPNDRMITAGWWFQALFIFHFIYGMSSFRMTNSYFSRWAHCTTNQVIINHH